MRSSWVTALRLLLVLSCVTGVVYPLAMTALAQLLFPARANGSLVRQGDRVMGSELLGQSFQKPEYFWGRLSATAPYAYNATASGGSNFGPLHPDLKKSAAERVDLLVAHGAVREKIPVDLVTASGSGLDPHISPAAAAVQVARVAAARGLSEEKVNQLVDQHTEGRQFGLLGERRVHVLKLNLALDAVHQP